MRELGYVEGQSFVIEYRSADGRTERYPDLAAELVRLEVDAIVTRGTPAVLAAKNATSTIPIISAALAECFWWCPAFGRNKSIDVGHDVSPLA
jgi:ABC-type uncharacterized transport system substrate-binding protein